MKAKKDLYSYTKTYIYRHPKKSDWNLCKRCQSVPLLCEHGKVSSSSKYENEEKIWTHLYKTYATIHRIFGTHVSDLADTLVLQSHEHEKLTMTSIWIYIYICVYIEHEFAPCLLSTQKKSVIHTREDSLKTAENHLNHYSCQQTNRSFLILHIFPWFFNHSANRTDYIRPGHISWKLLYFIHVGFLLNPLSSFSKHNFQCFFSIAMTRYSILHHRLLIRAKYPLPLTLRQL